MIINIRDMQKQVHALAVEKGWWPELKDGGRPMVNDTLAKLALVHSEISEAVEAVREGRQGDIDPVTGKPEGIVFEIADAVIRCADLCEALGIDLQNAIERKHEYNQGRAYRHGGKLA